MTSLFAGPKMPTTQAATKMPDPEDKGGEEALRMREARRRKTQGRAGTDLTGSGVPAYSNTALGE